MRGSRQQSLSRRELAEEERKRKKAERDEIRQSRNFQPQVGRRSRQGTGSSIDSRSPTRQSYDMEHYQQQMQMQQQYQQHPGGQHPPQQQPTFHQQPSFQQQQSFQHPQQQQQQQLPYSQSMSSPHVANMMAPLGSQSHRAAASIIDNLPQPQYPTPAQPKTGFFSKIKTAFTKPGTSRSHSMQQQPSYPGSGAASGTPSFQSGGANSPMERRQSSNGAMQPDATVVGADRPPLAAGAMPASYQSSQPGSQTRDMQISILEAQVQELEEVKRRLAQEQQTSNMWKEKWNYQNFKLNLTVDMLVLRALELESGAASGPRNQASAPAAASAQASGRQGSSQPWASESGISSMSHKESSSGTGARVIKKAPQVQATEFIEDSIEDWA